MNQSKKPHIADLKPIKKSLEIGKEYAFCSCGKSAKQPFCDGSHKEDNAFAPLFFTAVTEEANLCQCKHSGNLPFCDGTHKNLKT